MESLQSQPSNSSRAHRPGTMIYASFCAGNLGILSISANDEEVMLWDVATGKLHAGPFRGQKGSVFEMPLTSSQDLSLICTGSSDGIVRLWETRDTDALPTLFRGHTGSVTSVSLSLDGRYIVSGSVDMSICLWSVTAPEIPLRKFSGHSQNEYIMRVAFCECSVGPIHVTSATYHELAVWEMETGGDDSLPPPVRSIGKRERVGVQFTFSSSFIYQASDTPGSQKISIWDTRRNKEKAILSFSKLTTDNFMWGMVFSADDKFFASVTATGTLHVWHVGTSTLIMFAEIAARGSVLDHLTFVAFAPDRGSHSVLVFHHGGIEKISYRKEGQWNAPLFWVPGVEEQGFWYNENTVFLGGCPGYCVDYTNFVHGQRWTECRGVDA